MPVLPAYRNQSIDLHTKSIDWFLYEGSTGIYWVNQITRLIVINITPLTEFFCNFHLGDLKLSAAKRYYIQYKVFVGLMWLSNNHKFSSGDF